MPGLPRWSRRARKLASSFGTAGDQVQALGVGETFAVGVDRICPPDV